MNGTVPPMMTLGRSRPLGLLTGMVCRLAEVRRPVPPAPGCASGSDDACRRHHDRAVRTARREPRPRHRSQEPRVADCGTAAARSLRRITWLVLGSWIVLGAGVAG